MARRLNLVSLEERSTPAVFVVTTNSDNGDSGAPTPGSLRAAIVNANANAGLDQITFNIAGAGVQTINLPTPLPIITDAIAIDGTTQSGYAGVPVIELNGLGLILASNGLFLSTTNGSTIRGLTINNFKVAGIRIDGGSNNIIQSNLIGTNATGTASAPNGIGVQITGGSSGNTVGGVTAAERNIISGNAKTGVRIDSVATNNTIAGNFIGTTINGTIALSNGSHGIEIVSGSRGNTIGGTINGTGNIIAGNVGNGIRVGDATTASNQIRGNRIGVGFSGTGVGNGLDGIRFDSAAGLEPAGGLNATTSTLVSNNVIASNAGNGIAIRDTSRGVRIEQNSISSNSSLGIVVDATAQGGQVAPVLTGVITTVNGVSTKGTFVGPPNTAMRLEVFGNSAADPSGIGEGQTFLATQNVTTDSKGTGSFIIDVGSTPVVSATIQNTTLGETSAFSNALAKDQGGIAPEFNKRFAVGAGPGGMPNVRVYEPQGQLAYEIAAFDSSFTGGIRVAMGDVNGDGANDLIVGSGPGIATTVKIFDGKTQQILRTLSPFESSFTGGVYVSAGNLDGMTGDEFVISPDEGGGPRVRVFQLNLTPSIADFFGIDDPNFRGGARTAIGDLNGDGKSDLIVAAGFGGGPRVAAYSGPTIAGSGGVKLFGDFFAYETSLRNGTFVAAGDINGDGFGELITGGGPGGGPRVTAFSGKDLTQSGGKGTKLVDFFAGNVDNRGGIRIAARLVTGDGLFDIVTGDGPGGAGIANLFTGASLNGGSFTPSVSVTPFGNIAGGVFVG